jgi:hypothetical protein
MRWCCGNSSTVYRLELIESSSSSPSGLNFPKRQDPIALSSKPPSPHSPAQRLAQYNVYRTASNTNNHSTNYPKPQDCYKPSFSTTHPSQSQIRVWESQLIIPPKGLQLKPTKRTLETSQHFDYILLPENGLVANIGFDRVN